MWSPAASQETMQKTGSLHPEIWHVSSYVQPSLQKLSRDYLKKNIRGKRISPLVSHCCALLRKEGARLSFHFCQETSHLHCSPRRSMVWPGQHPLSIIPGETLPHLPGGKGSIQEHERSSPRKSPLFYVMMFSTECIYSGDFEVWLWVI